ncbi:hypothetical protein D3C71_1515510 [compost metagenome]
MATLSLRSPPVRFIGPKFIDTAPLASGPKVMEKYMMSRSSPWTLSRFLTKSGSSSDSSKYGSKLGSWRRSSSSKSSMSFCCSVLKVTTPIVSLEALKPGDFKRLTMSATNAFASALFTRAPPFS